MTKESAAARRDRQTKIDAHVSKIGQRAAQRYLDTHESPNSGNIREWIAGAMFATLMILLATIRLAL
jgi:hypothetical protein